MRKLVFFTLFLCLFSFANAASKSTPRQKKLIQLTSKILTLRQSLSNANDKKNTLMEELANTEKKISALENKNNQTKRNLQQQKVKLLSLKRQAHHKQEKLRGQQNKLAEHIQLAYRLGKHNYLKLLFNDAKLDQVSRMWAYYAYINRSQAQLIKDMQHNLSELISQQREIQHRTQKLISLIRQFQHQQEQLQEANQYRQEVINEIALQIQSKDVKLSELLKNKRNLESIFKRLLLSGQMYSQAKSFYRMRHHLPWPTHGHIEQTFGQKLGYSHLTSNGVFITSTQGHAVHAIYPGKIVFSDWLRGFGLVIIIEHTGHYLSLYAHNHSLYKTVGEHVDLGDLIATVGHSGGINKNGLYFEIRHKGKPLDPQRWCARM